MNTLSSICPTGLIVVTAAALALTGCSGDAPAPAPGSKPSATAPAAVAMLKNPATSKRSVFTVDGKLPDPFFPGSKRAAPQGPTTQPPTAPVDIPSLLQAGFSGVIGVGESRIALIHNTTLEVGRTVTIPLTAGGQRREVTVKVRQILPNAVVLEIPGQRQPITIRRPDR